MPRISGARYQIDGWEAEDLPDGRVHIWKDMNSSVSMSAWGNLYEARVLEQTAYPFTFTDKPEFWITWKGSSGYALIMAEYSSGSTTATPTIYAIRPNNPGTIYWNGTIHAKGYRVVS